MAQELTLSLLEMGYQNVTFGYEEPTHLRAHVDTLEKVIKLLEATPRYKEYVKAMGKGHIFNNALLIKAKDLSPDVIHFCNIKLLGDDRFNCWLIVGASDWHSGAPPVSLPDFTYVNSKHGVSGRNRKVRQGSSLATTGREGIGGYGSRTPE